MPRRSHHLREKEESICLPQTSFSWPSACCPAPWPRPRRPCRSLTSARQKNFGFALDSRWGVLLPTGERPVAPERPVAAGDLSRVLELATGASVHAAAESIRQGFVTAPGGCRIGLCGTAAVSGGSVTALRALTSAAIRIPRACPGIAGELLEQLQGSALLLSPPGGGKTTLLREIVRCRSDGGLRVALADERGEVAAVWEGTPQFDVGTHTDILTGAPKASGALMLLRAMNPQLIAMDEITAPEDVAACTTIANCGVEILATVHAADMQDLERRPLYRELLGLGLFRQAVCISRSGSGQRTYKVVNLC